MRNLQLNILEKRRMEGWPSQADRNRSDHLIFDVQFTNSIQWLKEPREFLPEWGMVCNCSPSQAVLNSAFKASLGALLSSHSCVGVSWELIHTAHISSRAEGIIPHVPTLHHPHLCPFWSPKGTTNWSWLCLALLSPNWADTGESHGTAELTSPFWCFSSSSEDEQCQVEL